MDHPFYLSANGKRRFAAFPVAVVGFIMDEQKRFLLFRMPGDEGWQVVCGGLEEGETPLEGMLRECKEEAGASLDVKPLGAFHSYSYEYDSSISRLLCIAFLLKCEGGKPTPGDDMNGATFAWYSLDQIVSGAVAIKVPVAYDELFVRAASVYDSWLSQKNFRVDYLDRLKK